MPLADDRSFHPPESSGGHDGQHEPPGTIAAVVAPTRGNSPITPTSEWPALACARSRSATRSSCGPDCWFSVRQILGPLERRHRRAGLQKIRINVLRRLYRRLRTGNERAQRPLRPRPLWIEARTSRAADRCHRCGRLSRPRRAWGAAPWFSMAGELPPAGDSSAVSCRYAFMNARFVVDMAGLTRGTINQKAWVTGHFRRFVRLRVIGRLALETLFELAVAH